MKKGHRVMTITIGVVCFVLTYVMSMQFKIVEETKKRLKANSNYEMCIDNLLFNMTFIIHN